MKRLLVLLLLLAWPAAAQQPAVASISVDGTEFVVALQDGQRLHSRDLVGAVLDVRLGGAPVRLRIAAVERDPGEPSGSVWLHTLEWRKPDGSWTNLCGPGPDQRRQGFPLVVGGELDLVCSSGALGKCVRFGYRPWTDGTDGTSLARLHAACVRMVRGDYGGDGVPWTRTGMLIDVFDGQGIQRPDEGTDLALEAGWTPEGAVCVHHVRVAENVSLAALEDKYPRLRGRTGAVCTEAFARANGAILFNRSTE